MTCWVKKLGSYSSFILSIVLISAVLSWRIHEGSAQLSDTSDTLFYLYFLPILIAALFYGETGGVAVALCSAIAAGFVAIWGNRDFSWLTWLAVGMRGGFYLLLAFLAGRLSARMNSNAREWQSLLEITRNINSSLNLDETLQAITRNPVELRIADASAIRMLRDEGSELVFVQTYGLSDQYIRKGPMFAHDSPAFQCAVKGQDIILSDVRTADIPYREVAIAEGITSIMSLPLRIGDEVIGFLNLYRKGQHRFSSRDQRVGRVFAEQAASAIRNARLYESVRSNYFETVRALTRAIEARDPMTLGHSERVTEITLSIAREMKLTSAEVQTLEFGAMLHDIGKIGLDEQTLTNTGRLTVDERILLEMHTMIGNSIIGPIEFLRSCLPIVMYHHERWDGMGYPEGLSGTDIPLHARIVAVANGLDYYMYHSSPFPICREEAMGYVLNEAGGEFDPQIVEILAEIIDRVVEECRISAEAIPDQAQA